ncbi:MAG: hypothetical protein QXU28_06055 [Nitrososphaerota archaeon]
MSRLLPLLISILLIYPAFIIIGSGERVSFRVEQLTLSEALSSVDFFKDGFIAVGGRGIIVVVYDDGYRIVERQAHGDLLDVSCIDRYCMVVGVKGSSIIYDTVGKTFKRIELPIEDYFKVIGYRKEFYIAYQRGVIIYSPTSGPIKTILSELIDIEIYGDKIILLGRDSLKVMDLEGGEVQSISLKNVKNLKKIKYVNNTLWLLGDYLYRFNGTGFEKVLEQSYDSLEYDGSIILLSKNSIYRLKNGGLELITTLEKAKNIKAKSGRMTIIGEGYIAEFKKDLRYLFIPQGAYTYSSSDNHRAIVVGSRILIYENGYFKIVQAPQDNYISASIEGDRIVVLSSKNVLEVRGDSIKTLPYRSEGYTSILLYNGKILLTSSRGLFEIDPDTYSVKNLVEANLMKVTRHGGIGEKLLVVPRSSGYEKVSINFTARDVSGAGCTTIVVGDRGSTVLYRNDVVEYVKVGRDPLTAVGLNRKYGLIGDSKGNLYLFDGYVISPIPYSVGEEVKSISWIDDREALIVTSKNVYRFIEEYYPEPRIEIVRPQYIRTYNGSETRMKLLIRPLNGYSEYVELTPIVSIEGVSVSIEPSRLYVEEMCPVEVYLRISSMNWAKGSGRLEIIYDGFRDEVNIIVEQKIVEKKSEELGMLNLLIYIIPIAIVASTLAFMIPKLLKKKEKREEKVGKEEEIRGEEVGEW